MKRCSSLWPVSEDENSTFCTCHGAGSPNAWLNRCSLFMGKLSFTHYESHRANYSSGKCLEGGSSRGCYQTWSWGFGFGWGIEDLFWPIRPRGAIRKSGSRNKLSKTNLGWTVELAVIRSRIFSERYLALLKDERLENMGISKLLKSGRNARNSGPCWDDAYRAMRVRCHA